MATDYQLSECYLPLHELFCALCNSRLSSLIGVSLWNALSEGRHYYYCKWHEGHLYFESSLEHTSQRTAIPLVVQSGWPCQQSKSLHGDAARLQVLKDENAMKKVQCSGINIAGASGDGECDVTYQILLPLSFSLSETAHVCQLFMVLKVIMAAERASKLLGHSIFKVRACRTSVDISRLATASRRGVHQSSRISALTASSARLRPKLQPLHQPTFLPQPLAASGSRTIFIQTENTPNADVSEDDSR